MSENQEQPVVDVTTYTQDLLAAIKEEHSGDPAPEDVGEEATEEGQKTEEDGQGEQQAGEKDDESIEEGKPEVKEGGDKLDQLEVWLKKEKEHVRKELELKERYKDAPTWQAKADEWDKFAKDSIGYLEEKAPQLLEYWIEKRYGSTFGKGKQQPQQQQKTGDPRVDSLLKEVQALKDELVQSKNASLVDQYVSSIGSAIREYSSKDDTKEQFAVVDEYCKAHGYDLNNEVLEYAKQVAATTRQVVDPKEALKAVYDYVVKDLEVSSSISKRKSAKNDTSSEEKKPPKSKTLNSGLKGSAVRPEEPEVTDLDSYKADLLRELRKGH